MPRLVIILLGFWIFGTLPHSYAQKYHILRDSKKNQKMIVGECKRSVLQSDTFQIWFNKEYSDYKVDNATLDKVKPLLKNVKVTIILGTWCSDSRTQVPRFFKMMDYLKIKSKKIRLICIDRDKKAPELNISEYKVTLVPTFIFYKNGVEIGRIIESPLTSLEIDLLKLLAAPSEKK